MLVINIYCCFEMGTCAIIPILATSTVCGGAGLGEAGKCVGLIAGVECRKVVGGGKLVFGHKRHGEGGGASAGVCCV